MKRIRKRVLLLGLAGPAIMMPSCSSLLVRDIRDAAITGVSNFVQQAAFDLLDTGIGAPAAQN